MQLRSLIVLGVLATSVVNAAPAVACLKVCHFGGHNTSCLERIRWVKKHVNSWDQVVDHVTPSKALSCDQARGKVLKDCPVCQHCPTTRGLCTNLGFKVGDAVQVLYFDHKWHFGHITKVMPGGKWEVELKHIPLLLETSHVRSAGEMPDETAAAPSPHVVALVPETHGVPSNAIAAKFMDLRKVADGKAFNPQFFVGMTLGGVSIIGLSVLMGRKIAKRSHTRSGTENLADAEE